MSSGFVVINEVTREFAADNSGSWVRCKTAALVFDSEIDAVFLAGTLSLFLDQDCKAEPV